MKWSGQKKYGLRSLVVLLGSCFMFGGSHFV